MKILKKNSFILVSGNLKFDPLKSKIINANLNSRIKLSLPELNKDIRFLFGNIQFLKILKGEIKSDLKFVKKEEAPLNEEKKYKIFFNGFIDKLKIKNILLGKVFFQNGSLVDKTVKVKNINLNLPGGNNINIKNSKFDMKKDLQFFSDIKIDQFELHSFLKKSGIAVIPVWLNVSGHLNCKGTYKKNLNIHCPGQLKGRDLLVQGDQTPIINIKNVDVKGNVNITDDLISYQIDSKMEKSRGKSNGQIHFKKGFFINYESDLFDFSEIEKISGLKFSGLSKIKGSTTGNSQTARFKMNIDAKNFEFQDYYFGNLNSNLNYKSGVLSLKNLKGYIKSTEFNGFLDIFLLKNKIKGQLKFPFIRMIDVQKSISKRLNLENRFLGAGSAEIFLNTYLSLDQLGFSLNAKLFKGSVFGEKYTQSNINAVSKNGVIKIKKMQILKNKTFFEMKGEIDTKLNTNFYFHVSDGELGQSKILRNLNIPFDGNFLGTGKISGPLSELDISSKLRFSNLMFNNKKYGNALFAFNKNKKQTSLQLNIPKKMNFFFVIPKNKKMNYFVSLYVNQFDFSPLLSFLNSTKFINLYKINTTGEVHGTFDRKNIWNSNLSSKIEKVEIDYKKNRIVSQNPVNIILSDHIFSFNNLEMKGLNQFLKIKKNKASPYSTKINLTGKLNVGFFKIFAPFLDGIDGYSFLNLNLNLKKDFFKLIGSSYIKEGFLKFPIFPHPIEDIKADILFNQNKLLIDSIRGKVADGQLLGDGRIEWRKKKKFKIDMNFKMKDVNIHFPQDIRTRGNGQIYLKGNGLPLKLSGIYEIENGLIQKEVSGSELENSNTFLKDLLQTKSDNSINLDLDIKSDNFLSIQNSLITGRGKGNIRVFGKINAPKIKGQASLSRGSILQLRDNEFNVQNSDIQFKGRYPINPDVLLQAQSRIGSYDINLLYQKRKDSQETNVSSQPPLTEQQIFSILAFGQVNTQLNSNLSNSQSSNQNQLQIGTSLLSNNLLGRQIKNQFSGLDFQFSSSFDNQNSVATPKFSFNYRISEDLRLSGSRTTGNVGQTEGRIIYQIDKYLSTIFRITDRQLESNDTGNATGNNRNNPLGIDFQYTKEFD